MTETLLKGTLNKGLPKGTHTTQPGSVAWLDGRPPGIQRVVHLILQSSNIFLVVLKKWFLVLKSFLRPFSPYR